MKQKQTVQLVSEKHSENISNMLNVLYKEESFSDVTLCCKNGSIRAHKIILAACSPYFKTIFIEHRNDHPLIIMPGINISQLENLVDLMYKGSTDVAVDNLSILNSFVEELEITDVLQDEFSRNCTDNDAPIKTGSENNHGRDTRFKGLKRVAVDYKQTDDKNPTPPKVEKKSQERRPSSDRAFFKKSSIMAIATALEMMPKNPIRDDDREDDQHNHSNLLQLQREEIVPNPAVKALEAAQRKADLWSKKPRKYQCELCPSSFKRASHLTRHQLVHTGERPYACNQCDKAFSRHDKLKHHIKKAHEDPYLINPEWIGHPQIDVAIEEDPPLSPSAINSSLDLSIVTEEEDQKNVLNVTDIRNANSSSDNTLNSSYTNDSNRSSTPSTESPVKKGRGRPRKYPKLPPPLIKRGRGRPRIHPVHGDRKSEHYDITNLPFGDFEYLTRPLRESISGGSAPQNHAIVMEPLVEIKTEVEENNLDDGEVAENIQQSDEECGKEIFEPSVAVTSKVGDIESIEEFENKIGKIGECTISVAPPITNSTSN